MSFLIDEDVVVSGIVFVGDTANTFMTQGVTISGGGNDDEHLALKNSDIAHAMTDEAEADTFFTIGKTNVNTGGVEIVSYGEGNASMNLVGRQNDGGYVTTDTSTSLASVNLIAQRSSGTGVQDMAANGNVVAMTDGSNTRWLLKGNGDVHTTTLDATNSNSVAATALDDHEDNHLVRALAILTTKDTIKNKWDEYVSYNEQTLIDAGVLGEKGLAGGLMNQSQLLRLHNGALWQTYSKLMDVCEAIEKYIPELRGKLIPQGA